jgi:hypothetical protein
MSGSKKLGLQKGQNVMIAAIPSKMNTASKYTAKYFAKNA